MDKLRFGPAGIPYSNPGKGILDGVKQVRTLNLDSMELEFVRSVYLNEQTAPPVKEAAKKHDILLTCHGSYYINLNSNEPAKIHASHNRILKAARIGNMAGCWGQVFHPAFYMKQDPKKVYDKVKAELKEIVKTLQDESNPILMRPETTGKLTQFGTLKETIKLSQEVEQVLPCIDFSHLHARSIGKENTLEEFRNSLELIEKGLGREGLNNMHIHVSGIEYGERGEKHHLILKESDMNWKDLMKAFKEFKIKGVVISESPNQEDDARLMLDFYNQ